LSINSLVGAIEKEKLYHESMIKNLKEEIKKER
jgi:hypothetical protein